MSRYLHVSKELHVVPDPMNPWGYKFVIYRGDGKTYNYGRNQRKREARSGLYHWQWRRVS
jgi:hypothetical protein